MSHSYISFWEHDAWLKEIDIAIIGSGIVGLSSAYFIKSRFPNKHVMVLERGFLPHGATTRNAGFSCFGSPSEILSDIKKSGKEKAYALVRDRFDGLNALLQLHHPDEIGYENFGGYEIFQSGEQHFYEECVQELEILNKDLQDVLQLKSNIYEPMPVAKAKELGLLGITGIIFNPWEGQLHSGKLMQSLIKKCRAIGVEIITGINISSFYKANGKVVLVTEQGAEIKTSDLIITVNGFARDLISDLDVQPARGQVLVTTPITDLKLKGTFHHHEGFDYFRNIGNRILIGGGRDLDIETETTTTMERNEKIYEYLVDLLHRVVAPGKEFTIEHEWSGTMGVGNEKSPIIKQVHDQVYVAVRMGGMGVAIGTNVGKKVAAMLD